MSAKRKNRNRVIAISIAVVLIAALILGIWFFIQYRKDQKTVEVTPVMQIADYYWPDQTMSSGMVVSNNVQEIYVSDKVVSEFYVHPGTSVHIGDALLQYDKTRLGFEVEAKEIALREADLKIEDAQRQLKKLQNTKPASTARPIVTARPHATATPRPTAKPTPKPTATPAPTAEPSSSPTPTPPDDVKAYKQLDLSVRPYVGSGTTEDPYVFLCTEDCVITPQFLRCLLGINGWDGSETGSAAPDDGESSENPEEPEKNTLVSPFAALFEVREGDSRYGELKSSFQLDGTQLSGGFQFAGKLTGYNTLDSIATLFASTPSPTPTPTPEPAPADPSGRAVTGNYNDMEYTAAELNNMIAEKKQEIKDLQLARKQAKLDLDRANLQLQNSTVLSTVDGVVRTLIDEETAAAENKPFLVVSGDSTYYVSGAITENMLGSVHVGDLVTVNDYMSGGTYSAQIVSISDYPLDSDSNLYYYGSGNPNSSSYEFVAAIDGGEGLQSGNYVDITLDVQNEEEPDALYIMNAYVREDDGGSYVMKAGVDDRLVKQYVRTGRSLSGYSVEIKSGLTIDDYVAFPYGADVKEGMRVVLEGSDKGPMEQGVTGETEGGAMTID